MKTKFLIAVMACLCFFISGNLSAQSFEQMPAEVQKKINDNKSKGLPLTTGVWVDYELTIEGVTDATTAGGFETFLKKECGLKTFRFDPVTKHVFYTVPAEYDLDGIASRIKSSGYGIGLFFKEVYHL